MFGSKRKPADQAGNDWLPQTDSDRDAVRRELEAISRDALFNASKRYPGFLRYVVEQAIQGHAEELKERTIGIEVFGRDADYDSTLDNIVRATAVEIRKRLTQYYAQPGREREICIALLPGSYAPKFFKRAPAAEPRLRRVWWALAGIAAVLLVIVSLFFLRTPHQKPEKAIDLFWGPFLDWNGPILISMGSHDSRVQLTSPAEVEPHSEIIPPRIRLLNAVSLANLTGFLQSRSKTYRVRDDLSTTFADLRAGPAIILGGLNNQWAMRLTAPLRFSIKWDPVTHTGWISDRLHPSRKDWAKSFAPFSPVYENVEDHALISRFVDRTTGQMVVVISGLRQFANLASSELLLDSRQLELLAEQAPRGWEMENLQLVITTNIIQGSSGRPQILESHFWPR